MSLSVGGPTSQFAKHLTLFSNVIFLCLIFVLILDCKLLIILNKKVNFLFKKNIFYIRNVEYRRPSLKIVLMIQKSLKFCIRKKWVGMNVI